MDEYWSISGRWEMDNHMSDRSFSALWRLQVLFLGGASLQTVVGTVDAAAEAFHTLCNNKQTSASLQAVSCTNLSYPYYHNYWCIHLHSRYNVRENKILQQFKIRNRESNVIIE